MYDIIRVSPPLGLPLNGGSCMYSQKNQSRTRSDHRSLKFDPSITPIASKPKAHYVITVSPPPWGCHSMVAAVCIVKKIRAVPGPTLCLNGLETLWIRSSPDFCKSDPVPGCLFLSCQSIVETDLDQIGSNLCWICAGPKLFEAAEIPN